MISKTRIIIIILIGSILLFYWDLPYLLPLKLFVVLVHEICHALAAIAFGGSVESIILHLDESGFTKAETSLDSSFIVIVSSGYIGSTFIGGFLLNRGLKGRWVFGSLFTLGLLIISLSLKFVTSDLKNIDGSGPAFLSSVFGICWGLFFIISASFGKHIGRTILIFIGTLSSLYCIFDFGDFVRGVETTDASILASFLLKRPFPVMGDNGYDYSDSVVILAYMIAVIWALITLMILIFMIRSALNVKQNQEKEKDSKENEMNGEFIPGDIYWEDGMENPAHFQNVQDYQDDQYYQEEHYPEATDPDDDGVYYNPDAYRHE